MTIMLPLLYLLFGFYVLFVQSYESVEDAARIARRLIEESSNSIGTMATMYPFDYTISQLAGQPFSLQEYYASCFSNGSLTLLFLPISRHSQNILHSPTHAASLSITSDHPAASRARVSLIGNVTIFHDDVPDESSIRDCYIGKHPDARYWLPKGKHAPHVSYWARFDPQSIYFVGGFGGEHYIGYIPPELYAAATPSEVSVAGRLVVQH